MNTVAAKYIAGAFSMKSVIRLIAWVIGVICILPFIAVIILSQAGFSLVSNALASSDPQTNQVQIHDPTNGSVAQTITDPRIWPVTGKVTLEFGQFDPPYQPFHTGIDIAAPNHKVGDPVAAFMAGTVIYADSISWGYGTHVVLDNGNHITSIYGHLNSLNVTKGEHVEMGQIIGTRGSTGWSTGPHVHFEVRVYGIPVNPRTFLEGNP